jgi:molybdenum cofactor cytidylyltransferase
MSVGAIVLAAGGSRRLGQPKQLLVLHGETLVARAIRIVGEAGATPIVAVLGARSDVIRESLGAGAAMIVNNGDWREGISTSVVAGMRALLGGAPDSSGVLLVVCDQPRLEINHLRALIQAFEDRNEESIVASEYAGVQGVPAIFPRSEFSRLFALRGDRGARMLIAGATRAVVALPFEGGEIDIDEPEDLEQIR